MSEHSKHIILFDGFCVLCNSSVEWLLHHDKKGLFMFAPLQSLSGKQLSAKYDLPNKTDTVIMISDGKVYMHSEVMIQAMKLLGGGYTILSWLSVIPKVLRDGVYRFVAKNRYKWFGKKEACVIPDPKWRKRFLE